MLLYITVSMPLIFLILIFPVSFCSLGTSPSKQYLGKRLIEMIEADQADQGQELLDILQSKIELNFTDEHKITPLMHAAYLANDKVVRLLLHYGAHVDYAPEKNSTPLALLVNFHISHVSSSQRTRDYSAVIITLLLYGADFSQFTSRLRTALEDILPAVHRAILFQEQKQLKKLLMRQTSWFKKLINMLFSSRLDSPQETANIDPEQLNKLASINRITPLHLAAARGSLVMVEQLIAAGAHRNPHDNFGNTPLHYAAFHNHLPIIKALLTAGADIKSINNDTQTPLEFALNVLNTQEIRDLIQDAFNSFDSLGAHVV